MIHPDTELRQAGEKIGLGVFATRRIPRGTIVWVLDDLDQRFDAGRIRALGPRYASLLDRYGYLNGSGERVLCWDLARWVNHSCGANAISTGWDFDIAVRDLEAGEELTNDYGCLNLERRFRCHCGEPACRRTVSPADFERLADVWDERVRGAFPELGKVPQPLWAWVKPKRAVYAGLRDPSRVPSIRSHRWLPEASERVAGQTR